MHAWNQLRAGFAAARNVDTIRVLTGSGYAGSVLTRIILDAGSWYVGGIDTGQTGVNYTVLAADDGKPIQFRTSGGFISNTIETFLPDDISDIVGWFDAKTFSSLTLVGSEVSAWASRVGTLIYSQATTANRPSYSATGRNSQPAISFATANLDILIANSPGLLPGAALPSTVSWVAYSSSANTDYRSTIGWGYGNSTGQYRNYGKDRTTSGTDSASADIALAGSAWINQDRIVVGQVDAAATQVSADGVLGTPVTQPTLNTTTPTYSNIGKGRNNDPRTWDGSMQEIVIHQANFTAAQRQKMEGYLAHHWALSSRLPSGHPYKTLAPLK